MPKSPNFLLVGVGQCGTQIADEVHTIAQTLEHGVSDCILVDSESKSIHSKAGVAAGQDTVLATDSCGRGNNWAHGYAGSVFEQGNALGSQACEGIRKSMESMAQTPCVVLTHSWGGGTGSGVGSYILEHMYDVALQHSSDLVSLGICPFQSGGSPLQSINTVLCAATVQSFCSAALVQYNDEVLHAASRLQSAGVAGKHTQGTPAATKPHMQDLNRIIAERVACILPCQHVGVEKHVVFPSLVLAESQPCPLFHPSCVQISPELLNQHAPRASLLGAALSEVDAGRRFLIDLGPSLAPGSLALDAESTALPVLLRCPASTADDISKAWVSARSKRFKSLDHSAAAAAACGSRSDWLFASSSLQAPLRTHSSIDYECQHRGKRISTRMCVDEGWQHSACAVILDNGLACKSPLGGSAVLASSKARIGAYMHLLEPYGVDREHVLDASAAVNDWCGSVS